MVQKHRVKGSHGGTTFLIESDAGGDEDYETVLAVLRNDDGTDVVPMEVEMPDGVPAAFASVVEALVVYRGSCKRSGTLQTRACECVTLVRRSCSCGVACLLWGVVNVVARDGVYVRPIRTRERAISVTKFLGGRVSLLPCIPRNAHLCHCARRGMGLLAYIPRLLRYFDLLLYGFLLLERSVAVLGGRWRS